MAGTHKGRSASPLLGLLVLAVATIAVVLAWLALRDGLRLPRGVDVAFTLPSSRQLPAMPRPEPPPSPRPSPPRL